MSRADSASALTVLFSDSHNVEQLGSRVYVDIFVSSRAESMIYIVLRSKSLGAFDVLSGLFVVSLVNVCGVVVKG